MSKREEMMAARHAARAAIHEKIRELECNGIFDQDAENDPPARALLPGEVDYLGEKTATRVKAALSNLIGKTYFDMQILKGDLVLEKVVGVENCLEVQGKGAVITCNHFHPFDHYAVYKALQPYLGHKRLYKVIREGNYTGFPGLYGLLFRHCNTLPIPSEPREFLRMTRAVETLLRRGEKVLIYPEQALWWNYPKPRPMKEGAFRFAYQADVPVLPLFITMRDTARLDGDGYPVKALTVHILPPIYPDKALKPVPAARKMAEANYAACKAVYESVYGRALSYAEGIEA